MKKNDIIYLAALVDGEGTISLRRDHSIYFRVPRISIVSTSQELVDWIPGKFGGTICQCSPLDKDKHLFVWQWAANRDLALSIMKAIKPYIKCKNKAERIRLILEKFIVVNKDSPQELKDKAAELELEFFRELGRKDKIIKMSKCTEDYLKQHPDRVITNYNIGKGPQ